MITTDAMLMPMRLSLQLLLAVLAVSTAFPLEITTRDGKTYKHAKVTGVYSDGLSITHSSGVIKVPFENLPDAVQRQYNYDPAKIAASSKPADEAAKEPARIRITTWNLEWFPNGSPHDATPEKQTQRIEAAAHVLRKLDPDILLLQEMRDYDACARLGEIRAIPRNSLLGDQATTRRF